MHYPNITLLILRLASIARKLYMNHGFIWLAIASARLCPASADNAVRWSALPTLPDAHGFGGMYAGHSGGVLIAAGGANFPDRPLAEGGKKIWHDTIYVLDRPDGVWREAGHLPGPCAYGVSANWRDAVACVGGDGPDGNIADAWLLRWDGNIMVREFLPPLPLPVSHACGSVVNDTFYVIGGQVKPSVALARIFALDLARPAAQREWTEIPWPAGAPERSLAVAGTYQGELFFFSGVTLSAGKDGAVDRQFLKDAYAFRAGGGWRRLADLPYAVPAAPGPAMATGPACLLVPSGINVPSDNPAAQNKDSTGFARTLLAYDPQKDRWSVYDQGPSDSQAMPARVTAPMVQWRDRFVVISGEIAPGIRTRTVLSLEAKP